MDQGERGGPEARAGFWQLVRWIVPLAGLVSLITGCASSVPLTKQARSSIQSVHVNRDVPKPGDIFYQGPRESALLGTLGLVGAAIASQTAKAPKAMLLAAMEQADIDLGRIARERFEEELTDSGAFASVIPEGGDAEFKLSVRIVGFGQPHGFSSQLKPMLGVTGSLVKADGSVLWERYAYVTNLNNQTPSHTLDEYLEHPELIREAFTVAARLVIGELVKDMLDAR